MPKLAAIAALLVLTMPVVAWPAAAADVPPIPAQKPHMHAAAPADVDWFPRFGLAEGIDCCANEHCRLTSYCRSETVGDGVVVAGECLPIPYDRAIPLPPGVTLPPGEVAVCATGNVIRCLSCGGEV